ncbi:MAG: DUF2071 domain-containing protein [bacterium]|nr:DUF2071 domain-containing protein [bacterium]
MSFLNAEWRKLAIANYKVDPEILKPFVPRFTELDLWQGGCYVSLVGFMFLNTKMLGVKIPGHINFEEVNLRFYVKYNDNGDWKRGVVFIKEIVPKPALTFVANTVYKENYQTMPMKHLWHETLRERVVAYQWKYNGKWNKFNVGASNSSYELETDSESEFITEHYWGYAAHGAKTVEYEVTHPRWNTYHVNSYEIDVDFGALYGDQFAHLTDVEPDSVMLAEGSEITVESKRYISAQ